MKRTIPRACALLLMPLIGCESVESTDVLTSGIYATLSAQTDGDGTHLEAVLRVGGAQSNTFLELQGSDILTVTAGDDTRELYMNSIGNYIWYATDMAVSTADTQFIFSFDRDVDGGAPDSHCTLPEAFSVTEPIEDATFSRGEDSIAIVWGPQASDPMRLAVSGECINSLSLELEGDTGSYVLNAGTLTSLSGHESETCTATIALSRIRAGVLDPGFGEGGVVQCSQARSADIRLNP